MLENLFWTWMCLALDARYGGCPERAAWAARVYFSELAITDLHDGPGDVPVEK
jgi:hypothetical protein